MNNIHINNCCLYYLLVLYVFWLWFDKSYSLEITRSWISYSLFIIIAIINPLFILVPHTGVYKQLSLLWKVLWKFFWMVLMVIIGLPTVETIWGIWTFVAVVNGKINNLVSSHKSWEVYQKIRSIHWEGLKRYFRAVHTILKYKKTWIIRIRSFIEKRVR